MHRYEFAQIKGVKVNVDYHMSFDRHHYSVPFEYFAGNSRRPELLTSVFQYDLNCGSSVAIRLWLQHARYTAFTATVSPTLFFCHSKGSYDLAVWKCLIKVYPQLLQLQREIAWLWFYVWCGAVTDEEIFVLPASILPTRTRLSGRIDIRTIIHNLKKALTSLRKTGQLHCRCRQAVFRTVVQNGARRECICSYGIVRWNFVPRWLSPVVGWNRTEWMRDYALRHAGYGSGPSAMNRPA